MQIQFRVQFQPCLTVQIPFSIYEEHQINKKDISFPFCNEKPERGRREETQLAFDIRYTLHLSFFRPQSVAFILILVISGSQNDISTTSLISGLRKKKKKGTRRSGAGPATDSRRTLRAQHWPELCYVTSPSCKGGWEIPAPNTIRMLIKEGKEYQLGSK